jgi:hypothetical protein
MARLEIVQLESVELGYWHARSSPKAALARERVGTVHTRERPEPDED